MADLNVNSIGDASGGNTATINSYTPTESNMAGRNLIINGNFDIWQRGTSFSADNTYTADRWIPQDSGATINISRQSFPVGQTDVPNNPKYFLRYEAVAGNDNARFVQRIENVDVVAGQDITVTYWAKLSSGTQPALEKARIRQEFGSGGSTTVYQAGDVMPTLTSSWQKITQHFTVSSVAGKTIGANDYFGVGLMWQTDSSTGAYTIDIAQVQVEVGTVATPFERRSYGQELALCQRYYQEFGNGVNNFSMGMALYDAANGIRYGWLYLPITVAFRAVPTITGSGINSTNFTLGGLSMASNGNINLGAVQVAVTGGSNTGQSVIQGTKVTMSAEL